MRNWNRAHHRVDGDEEEVPLTDGAAFPIRLAHRLSGDLDTGGVVGREDDLRHGALVSPKADPRATALREAPGSGAAHR